MKLTTNSVIEVFGWVMMKGLSPGKYKVVAIGTFYGKPSYTLAKPKGKNGGYYTSTLITHYADSVDAWIKPAGDPDLNRIEVVSVPAAA